MERMKLLLLSVVAVALCVIVFELAQLNTNLHDVGNFTRGFAQGLNRPPETRAQRNERLQHNQQELTEDALAILATPDKPTAAKPPKQPSR